MANIKFILVILLLTICNSKVFNQTLQVDKTGHYICTSDGKPFFYLGDTGWELFHRLNREEAIKYLDNRASKGFNVIQAVALAEMGSLNSPNSYGDQPLKKDSLNIPYVTSGNDPLKADQYDYWDHLEYIIIEASKRNIYIGLLPCWGDYVTPRFRPQVVFDDSLKGYNYGWFIGNMLKKYNNIIWILGGDRLPDERYSGLSVWRAMAEGITDAINRVKNFDGQANFSSTLMTYHSFYPSSNWFMTDAWIDFNMWGSYHEKRNNDRAFEVASYQWNAKVTRPTINGEPAYELGSVNYDTEAKSGYFDDFDVRQQAYWSVFAGCMGHTYGCGPIWMMKDKNKTDQFKEIQLNWYDALDLNGATQMQYLKNLMESRPFFERQPADLFLVSNKYDAEGQLKCTAGKDYMMVYIPTGKNIEVSTGKISGEKLVAWWYNPKNGESIKIGEFMNSGILSFNPPKETGKGNDWVLVIDDASKNYAAPGTKN